MKINVPDNHKVIVTIVYKKRFFPQILTLNQIFNLSKILNDDIRLYILSERYKSVHWSPFKIYGNRIKIKTVSYRYKGFFKYNYLLLDNHIISKFNIDFDKFKNKIFSGILSIKTIYYSALCLGFKPKIKNKKLIINNISISMKFIKNFSDYINEYVHNKSESPLEYLALDKMILSGVLTPLFLNKSFNFKFINNNNELIVPYPLITIFYFLYGKKYNINSYITYDKNKAKNFISKNYRISANRKGKEKIYKYLNGYEIDVKYGRPIFFVNNLPIVYYHKNKEVKDG